MTYKLNGKFVSLDQALVKTIENDVRYSIDGVSSLQGDIRLVLIQHNDGPPRVGSFSTNDGNLVFSVQTLEGDQWILSTSLNFALMNFGVGEFAISELTDTYAKGTFNFTADWSGEDAPYTPFVVSDGRFKARITRN